MPFCIDRQTIKDLELFSEKPSGPSILSFFNRTLTFGGKLHLKRLMEDPLDDMQELVDRREGIRFFEEVDHPLAINSKQMDFIDHYYRLNTATLHTTFMDGWMYKIWVRQNLRNDMYLIQMGVEKMIFLLLELEKFLAETSRKNLPAPLKKAFLFIGEFLRYPEITRLMKVAKTKPRTIRAYKYDYLFRDKYKVASKQLIELVYEFDAYMSVAKTAEQKQLTFPEYIKSDFPHLQLEGLYHPFIDQPVPNDLVLRDSQNLCFLSGPNMAGKSTFLKSLGLSIYLAHLGFPVPAQVMKTTVYKGLVTTINLPDDMGLGYSHFYSEVRRIKEVANTIKEKKSVFVIFDELFRGTNVKDALDASLLVIKSFAQIKRSTFFISTHITEIAEEITEYENIQFKLMDIKINNNKPIYSYKLLDGVSHERLGMWIVKNENIMEILDALK